MKHASGEIAIFMDSDGEVRPTELQLYVKALQEADIAIASKRHPNSVVSSPFVRNVLSYAFNVRKRRVLIASITRS